MMNLLGGGGGTHNVSSQLVTENIYIRNVQVMMSNVISSFMYNIENLI